MFITIDGFGGGLTASKKVEATALTLTLLLEGYMPKINGIRVGVEYGPGYNTVVWKEGDFEGNPVE
jgi:hypothetical protein